MVAWGHFYGSTLYFNPNYTHLLKVLCVFQIKKRAVSNLQLK